MAGEPLEALSRALVHMRAKEVDGAVEVRARLPTTVGVPFLRALMRTEAELLVQDADRLTERSEIRSDDERRAEAFATLVRRIASTALPP
jgi:hypothetical protein